MLINNAVFHGISRAANVYAAGKGVVISGLNSLVPAKVAAVTYPIFQKIASLPLIKWVAPYSLELLTLALAYAAYKAYQCYTATPKGEDKKVVPVQPDGGQGPAGTGRKPAGHA